MRHLVLIPTYNEKLNIRSLIEQIFQYNPEVNILVLDDNSPDGTAEVVKEMCLKDKRIHLQLGTAKNGLGKTYLRGFNWGLENNFDTMTEMDADFSHRPVDLVRILQAIEKSEVVVGSRYVQGGGTQNWGLHRKLISKMGTFYSNLILRRKLNDWTGGFNCWQKHVLAAIDLKSIQSDGYSFQIELKFRALKKGFKVQEIPILFDERREGQSKMSFGIIIEAIRRVWKIRNWKPTPLFSMAGAFLASLFLFSSMMSYQNAKADQIGLVINVPAYVYKKPDFDSEPIAELDMGARIPLSTKRFGPFYRTRTKQGVIGYVSDGDVKGSDSLANGGKSKKSSKSNRPWWSSWMIGPTGGIVHFTEIIGKAEYSDSMTVYGLRLSAPAPFLEGPFSIDLSVLYSSQAPNYYSQISTKTPSGSLLIVELPLLFSLGNFWGKDGSFYMGVGPALINSQFSVALNGVSQDLTDSKVGAVGIVGLVFRMKSIVGRLEPRYYLEKSNYYGLTGSLQYLF